jgi:hypothetical protein
LNRPSRIIAAAALAAILAWGGPSAVRAAPPKAPPAPAKPAPRAEAPLPSDFSVLPKPGTRVTLDKERYFVYGFVKPAKIGLCVMRVEVFTRDGKRDTTLVVKGDADMPSMRGAHTMGDKPFQLSKKGEYLLPIPIVMPGDWEVRLTFVKDGKAVLRGVYLFDI